MAVTNYAETEITEEDFTKIINNSHKLVVADFYAEWCMPCLMMTPILEDLSEQLKEVKFVKINVDDNQELSKKYNVSSIPCLIVFKEGKEIERIIGSHSAEMIESKIRKILNS